MSIADKLTLLANTKEALRTKLKLDKSVPFSKYPDYIDQANEPIGPKLQADFTTGTYKASGAAKTFEDLFTFSRAGKAWLVKETGLQEYAADVPRLDNGLLIEKEATNLLVNSIAKTPLLGGSLSAASFTEYTITEQIATFGYNEVNITNGHFRQQTSLTVGEAYTLSMRLKEGSQEGVIFSSPSNMPPSSIYIDNTTPVNGGVFSYTQTIDSGGTTSVRFGKSTSSVTNQPAFKVSTWQLEKNGHVSSFIPTTTAPVTRPADYLLNKITGTTVTGDWDSTLNLSIVSGKLVHSGYGRIRSLEIN